MDIRVFIKKDSQVKKAKELVARCLMNYQLVDRLPVQEAKITAGQ